MLTSHDLRERLFARPVRALPGEDDWSHAAVAAVFRPADADLELLFIRRAHDPRDPWSGQIGFPGGRREPQDQDLESTAVRETHEEIGLDLRHPDVQALGALDELQARARSRIPPLAIRPHAFLLSAGHPIEFRLSDEVAEVFWIPFATLTDPDRRTWTDAERAGLSLRFPAVDLGPSRVLWGLTHRMVADVLERLALIDDADRFCAPHLPSPHA
jgi:8-oxo-dGTP pyrophosphatase MutT (NUDIX family)